MMDAATVNRKVDAILRKNPRESVVSVRGSIKAPKTMSAAAINAELDSLDKRWSAVIDELIRQGRGTETASQTMQKTDPLSRKYQDIADRHSALKMQIQIRTGANMHRMPRGFGPLKDNPEGKRVTLLAANPARKKGVPYRNEAKAHPKDDPAWIGYAVHKVGSPGSAYVICPTKAQAIAEGQRLADLKNKQMGVTRIRYNVAQ